MLTDAFVEFLPIRNHPRTQWTHRLHRVDYFRSINHVFWLFNPMCEAIVVANFVTPVVLNSVAALKTAMIVDVRIMRVLNMAPEKSPPFGLKPTVQTSIEIIDVFASFRARIGR